MSESIPIDPLRLDQVRMDVKNMRLVRLRYCYSVGNATRFFWQVESLLDGERYPLDSIDLGDDAYTDMEVIAWAAQK